LQRVAQAGFRLVNLDCIVFAQRPKLSDHKRAIAERIAAIVGLPPKAVSVKAKTGEGLGEVGREEIIQSQVVALIERA
jgi:2-C-methyl-D-erythritol 2,4-cyclodiphosphate synthase